MTSRAPEDETPGAPTFPVQGRLMVEWTALLISATLVVCALLLTGAPTRLDNAIYDFSLSLRRQPAPRDIVIVAIDFPSMAKLGRWPWPRATQAQMLRNIAAGSPKAIACDILFQSRGPMPDDEKVRDAMTLAPVYLPEVLEGPANGHAGFLTRPTPTIASAARGFGLTSAEPDVDGIVRRAFLSVGYQGQTLHSLMSIVAGKGPAAVASTHSPAAVAGALARRDEILIPFAGPPGHYAQVSGADVIDGVTPPGLFKDRYVLVGATAPGLLDNYPTPVSSADGMPNIEVQANILDALLRHKLIHPMPLASNLALSTAFVWVLFLGLLRFKPGQMILQGPVGSIGIALLSVGALVFLGVWFPPTAAVITRTLVQIIWSARRLQAASDYFAQELSELQSQAGGSLTPPSKGLALSMGDSVSRQMALIDETKRRMSELRRFVNDVLANFPDPVFVVSPLGAIIMVNQAAAQLGRRLGLPTEAGTLVQPILETLEAAAGGRQKLWPPTTEPDAPVARGLAPGGRILEARYAATGHEGGEALGWTVHLVDVTDLISAMRQREEAMQLFTHDMRSPQSAILAALEHKDFRNVPAALREGIERNALRTISLADGFVRLAQAEATEYAFAPIDLYHLLGDAADALWTVAEAASVRIVVQDPGREFVISADRGLLARALINLLDNAIKFSPPGHNVACALYETTLRGRPAVACAIRDEASGMSQEQQQSLFRRFARTDVSDVEGEVRPMRANSIGLGLVVVHTVVTRHDGVIDCDSQVGQGTVFTIILPLREEAEAEAQSAA